MPFTNAAALKSAVAAHMARDDISDSHLDDFIVLSEGLFNFGMKGEGYDFSPLRVRDMETSSTLTPTSGIVTLPSTFLEPRRVVETASPRRLLEYITPAQAEDLYPSRVSGLACHYTIIGSSLYTFDLASNDIEVQHYRTIPPLASTDPNWLLTKHPNLYLRACLFHVCMFVKDLAEATSHALLLKALIEGMNAADVRTNFSSAGVYLSGPVP